MEPFNYCTERVGILEKFLTQAVDKYEFPSELPKRPGVNSIGKAINIRVNQFKVTQWPENDVYQYDVSITFPITLVTPLIIHIQILIGSGDFAKGKVMAVWKSDAVQFRLKQLFPQIPPLWDGNRLGW